MDSLVDLNSVGVRLGGQQVLQNINLSVSPGTGIGIVGPNGSGKTTLLRLLGTLVGPSIGDGHILGSHLTSAEVRKVRSRIGLISHQPALIEELTLQENLTHFARLSGTSSESLHKAVHVVGLENAIGRKVSESSFGMRRRLEVAWLLAARPKLLLLDEAKSGLDQGAQELIDALVALTLERGGAVVSVSHDEEHLAGAAFTSRYRLVGGTLVTAP